jgi:uncharacterized protein YjbI with pentapeptide repeats
MTVATPPDFSRRNLQGRSFRGEDLTAANFSYADIRSADFTGASLVGANFSHSLAGLNHPWRIFWFTLLILLAMVSGAGCSVTAVYLTRLFTVEYIQKYTLIPAIANLSIICAFTLAFKSRGFTGDLAIVASATAVAAFLLSVFLAPIFGVQGLAIADEISTKLLDSVAWGLSSLVIGIFVMTVGRLVIQPNRNGFWLLWSAWSVSVGLNLYLLRIWADALSWSNILRSLGKQGLPPFHSLLTIGAVAVLEAWLCHHASQQAVQENRRFFPFRTFALWSTTRAGTCFHRANLTHASFANATLKHADFSQAILTRTQFQSARQLDKARTEQTILTNPAVRQLLVTHQSSQQSYRGRNLKGAYLVGANLQDADLSEANLSEADLSQANLEHADLTRAQAIATDFRQAQLTAACLEAWNIDSSTQLEDVICDYLYLRSHQRERRPSSGTFAPGDFTELFQEITHTLDLIFRHGIHQKAFNYSLNQLQVEQEDIPLSIRSLEKKNNGVVVVRVDVPPEADKTQLHRDFQRHYNLALQAIEAKYQAELQAKDEQIELYRQQRADWKEVVQLLTSRPAQGDSVRTQKIADCQGHKLVILHVGEGDLTLGFPITLQVGWDQSFRSLQFTKGRLAPAPELFILYDQWRSTYRRCLTRGLHSGLRLDAPVNQVTNMSQDDFFQDCHELADRLEKSLNVWLNADSFRPIKERLLEQLMPSEAIQMVLQTDDRQLRRLPFQRWDFFERYPKAELALSTPDFERIEGSRSSRIPMQVLAILGDSTGIDLQQDQVLLTQLPGAAVTFLVEPQRQILNDHLWDKPWDILFFAGHSSSHPEHETGQLQINQSDRLTISQLKHALRKAIAQGLRLAIFNSCDGLGLARELAELHIPQMIVMREPVPDLVAQAFLKNFLSEFSSGKPLYQSVREAREKLQGLEDQFPCATWLPVICQNAAEPPLVWPLG